MLITRTPLRITLGGGGTDLPSYYQRFGGELVAAAISKYIYISVNETFTDDYFLKYSELERVTDPADVAHPIVREVLRSHGVPPAVEIVSSADIPSGTGLGSSGSFTVGLLRAVYARGHVHATAADLAREACEIEIDVLGRSVGKQDQYIAAFGGLTCFTFHPDGTVESRPLRVPPKTLHHLEDHLLMFFTGYSRDADQVLQEQRSRSDQDDTGMLDNLHYVKELGILSREALECGEPDRFADLLHEHWEHKKKRSASISNPRIDEWYSVARSNGARGGKLVGAGAGGFLLLYADDPRRLREAMCDQGLREVRFQFDHDGSIVMVRD